MVSTAETELPTTADLLRHVARGMVRQAEIISRTNVIRGVNTVADLKETLATNV